MNHTRHTEQRGQAFVELAVTLPFLLFLVFLVIEFGYTFYQEQAITIVAREGANLISRDTKLGVAENAIASATNGLNLTRDAAVILSVVQLGSSGPIIANRRVFGALSVTSALGNPPASAYTGSPDYRALNTGDPTIRVTTLPNGLTLGAGDTIYVTEVFQQHAPLTPLGHFGTMIPGTLYASAYF